ncbi:hypothetical protein AXF42_Ash011075 [Apostasia shenzhenica]|uniref:Uncharacterized protein n=1 Tax=Apostasia shenzhenica TaxID=1088818 RepID=A0A2H9ZR11_9ASPA|nr:hypothetical protein AXF42_Ash011075 [Apostasia shenzhenica]
MASSGDHHLLHLLLLLLLLLLNVTMSQPPIDEQHPWENLPYDQPRNERPVIARFACQVMVELYNDIPPDGLYAQLFPTRLSLLPEHEAYTGVLVGGPHGRIREFLGIFLATMLEGSELRFLVRVSMTIAVPARQRLSFNFQEVPPLSVHVHYVMKLRFLQPGERLYL